MSINKVEVYTMNCDRCGKSLYPKEDMIYHEDVESLKSVALQSGWNQLDKWYCSDCWDYLFKD